MVVLSLAEFWWIAFYAGELLAESQTRTFLFARFEWVGVVVLPLAWIAFVFEYTGRTEYLTRTRWAVLAIVPAVTLVAALFAYEGAIRTPVQTTAYGGVTALTGGFGPGMWLFALFTWLVVASGAILLVEFILEQRSLYRGRAAALVGAAVVPIAASYVFATDLVPTAVFDPTPIAFALSSLLAVVAIVEYDMFSRMPVSSHLASGTAVDAIDDPVFVLDTGSVVVDCNPAACALVGTDRESLLGRHADDVAVLADLADDATATTVSVEDEDGTAHYDVQTAPIDGDDDHVFGEVVTLRDVTERRERKQRLDGLNEVLRATLQEEMDTVQRVVDDGDTISDVAVLRERVSVALDVSDRAGELATMVSPESEPPADIVPIIHEEIDAAREWRPDVTFVLEASLGEWAYCSGLFEPVFRVSLRHAAERSLAADTDSVVGIAVTAEAETVTVTVSDTGDPLTEHEQTVLLHGAEPRPADSDDMGRWLVNWGVEQAGGTVSAGTDGRHTVLELTFPRTSAE